MEGYTSLITGGAVDVVNLSPGGAIRQDFTSASISVACLRSSTHISLKEYAV
jgi:mannose/fructose/N-acetylgalactosamine-specific phosphotransferase system component IIC